MNSDCDHKLIGINVWFIIEILSFYGYILAAVIYILTNICRSSCGWLKKHPDRHHFDFIAYHRKDLDWAAFVQILFNVNLCLIMIDKFITYRDEESSHDDKLMSI